MDDKAGTPYAAPSRLTLVGLDAIPEIEPGDDLPRIILVAITAAGETLRDGDVLVIAQKIISKEECRTVNLADISPSPEAGALAEETAKDPKLVELILKESTEIVRHREGVLIAAHRSGLVLANAGIDRSNVAGEETVLLLPEDSDASAAQLRIEIEKMSGRKVAIIINDSLGRAWRNGTIGTAIGSAGLTALVDMNGEIDRDGRPLQATSIALADELAAAASIVMGQGAESRPVVLIRGISGHLGTGSATDLVRPRDQDLFR